MKIIQTIQRVEKEMPFREPFICFEDEEITLTAQFQWAGSTLVKSITFTLENKIEGGYELSDLTSCENEEDGPFYRMNLVQNTEAASQSILEVDQNALGNLDLKIGKHGLFKFNCILPEEVEYYREHPCQFNSVKPKTKDGTIIVSI